MNSTIMHLMILIAITLSGCTQHTQQQHRQTTPIVSQDWPQHQMRIDAIKNWQATGKLGVKAPGEGGSATLRWGQRGAQYQIDFNGPFGQGNMSIEGGPGRVTFSGGGNPPQSAKTAEELLQKNTGWQIPLSQLTFWLRGLPDPSMPITNLTTNSQGLIGELNQAGWKIVYGDYLSITDATSTIAMPGRITAEFKEIRLTLLIRTWRLGDTE